MERNALRGVRGHAAFHRDYEDVFAPWLECLAQDLLAPDAVTSDRLRLLQWALFGLVKRLDEEGAFGGGWLDRIASEIRDAVAHDAATNIEQQLRKDRRRRTARELPRTDGRSNPSRPLLHAGVPSDRKSWFVEKKHFFGANSGLAWWLRSATGG